MATNSVKDIKNQTLDAALRLASTHDWNGISLRDVAAEAELPLSTLHDHFEDRFDLLAAYGRRIDRAALDAPPDAAQPARDRLFEILMARFDALNDDRAAVLSILRGLTFDPKYAIISLPHLARSMAWMLDACGVATAGPRGAARIAGLTAVYLKTLHVWRNDDSGDMAKTMAALDKNLALAEQWATTFKLTDEES